MTIMIMMFHSYSVQSDTKLIIYREINDISYKSTS